MAVAPYASTEKHNELVSAAMQLFHEQGYQRTTLAHVAARAKVPLGNVYYYFRTKEALAEVVLREHECNLRKRLDGLTSAHRDPRARLRSFILAPLEAAEQVVRFGCSHVTLAQEFEKLGEDSPLAQAATSLMSLYLEWTDQQFRELGIDKREARALAADLVGASKGALVLANTMRSKQLLTRQVRRLERWLEGVVG